VNHVTPAGFAHPLMTCCQRCTLSGQELTRHSRTAPASRAAGLGFATGACMAHRMSIARLTERSGWRDLAEAMAAEQCASVDLWCIFDNTASGAAVADALQFRSLLNENPR